MTIDQDKAQRQFLGHPIGLFVLFLTEMWERFSYYGMRAILVLYLKEVTDSVNPGLGWTEESAYALYGWYTMFVYVASIPGGLLADRYLGQRKSVFLGGLLLCAGHGVLAIPEMWAFYAGLILIVLGVGCLKPNISTMVGGLYKQGDKRRDNGFYIFYMGINLGAAAAALLVGYVGQKIGWHYGFGLAGIGMALGQLIYMWGQPYLKHVGNLVKEEAGKEVSQTNLLLDIFKQTNSLIIFSVVFVIGLYVFYAFSWSYGLLLCGLAFAFGVAAVIYNDGNKIEKDRILVTYLSFLIIIVFWGSFEQAGGLMNVYADEKTNLALTSSLSVPSTWFQSVNAIFILLFAPLVGAFWGWWRHRGKESSSLFKMAIGVIIMGWGFFFMSYASKQVQYDDAGEIIAKSGMIWLVLAYLFHTLGELCASPVALSFITKLSPARWVAFMMGAYFAATGLGNKVAGSLGEWSTSLGEFKIFTGIAVFCTVFGILVLLILPPLKRLVHGAEDVDESNNDEAEGFELAND